MNTAITIAQSKNKSEVQDDASDNKSSVSSMSDLYWAYYMENSMLMQISLVLSAPLDKNYCKN